MNKQTVFKAVALFAISLSAAGLQAQTAYQKAVAQEQRLLECVKGIAKNPQNSQQLIASSTKDVERADLVSALSKFAQDVKASVNLEKALVDFMNEIAGKNFEYDEENPDKALLIQKHPWLYMALYDFHMAKFGKEPEGKSFFLRNANAHEEMRKAQK